MDGSRPRWPHMLFDLAPLTDEQTDALIGALKPGLTAEERAAVAGALRRGAVLRRTSRQRN